MSTIYCMNCGAALDEGARFCTECGAPTLLGAGMMDPPTVAQVACPACGALNDSTSRYCKYCGAELTAQSVSSTAYVSAVESGSSSWRVRREPDGREESAHTLRIGIVGLAALLVAIVAAGFASGIFGRGDTTPAAGVVTTEIEASLDSSEGAEAQMGSAGTEVRADLAAYSWQELSIIAKEMSRAASREDALALAQEYRLVDEQGQMLQATKDVNIAGMGAVPMRLADVYHDSLANGEGKAGMTFLATDVTLVHDMKANDDNVGGWEASQLRSWLNSAVFDAMDKELSPLVVTVDKHTNNAGHTLSLEDVTSTLDRLWVPSVVEVVGPVSWRWDSDPDNSDSYNAVLNAEGSQYACFEGEGLSQTGANPSLVLANADGELAWWLRSSSASKDAHYRIVDGVGDPSNWEEAPVELGVCLGFCL